MVNSNTGSDAALTPLELHEIREKYAYMCDYSENTTEPLDILGCRDSNGDYLLHISVMKNDFRTVALLLRGGADINLKGDMSYTPLHYASTLEMFNFLLDNGANREALNEFGKPPEHPI